MSASALTGADWLVRPEVQSVFAALDADSGHTRAVGGVVRDTLLGRTTQATDIDMATDLLPVAVMQRAKAAGIAAYPTGIDHGTVTLRSGDTTVEVTTLRQDVETDGRHAQVAFGTDWTVDALRRDFTINALYCDADGNLFDPLGGLDDLLSGHVRFIGDADQRIAEDGLRVYRFFRFSASHGGQTFDPAGLEACRAAVGHLDHISPERIGAEMLRMLALPKVARTVGMMADIGLVDIAADAVDALTRYELLGGQAAASRLVLLMHGIDDLQGRWRLSNALVEHAKRVSAGADLVQKGKINWAAYRFGEDAVESLAVAASLDGWDRNRLAEAARELARLRVAPLPVTGKDLVEQGMQPGPDVGKALAQLERAWVESEFSLAKQDLLDSLGR